jgi:Tat protein translocase TatB subunit
MFNIGPFELIVILLVALIAVGPKKLPELARTLARTIQEFKAATNDLRSNLDFHINGIDELTESGAEKSSKRANHQESDKDNGENRQQ